VHGRDDQVASPPVGDRMMRRLQVAGYPQQLAPSPELLVAVGLALLGALLWALRPVIVSAAMSSAPQELSGSIVAFIYGANMSASFLAPLMAGLIADAYGLPTALTAIAFFPLSAASLTFLLLQPAHK